MTSICPNCRKSFTHVVLETIAINGPVGYQRAGVSYRCPMCSRSLGVQANPFPAEQDVVTEVGGK